MPKLEGDDLCTCEHVRELHGPACKAKGCACTEFVEYGTAGNGFTPRPLMTTDPVVWYPNDRVEEAAQTFLERIEQVAEQISGLTRASLSKSTERKPKMLLEGEELTRLRYLVADLQSLALDGIDMCEAGSEYLFAEYEDEDAE